jgi:peptide/nickel transport system permease protein
MTDQPIQLSRSGSRTWLVFRRNKFAVIGLIIVVLMGTSALLAENIAPYNPIQPDYVARLAAPSASHIFGTDELGRDIFSRLLYGARISLVISLIAEGLALTIGITLGLLSGWYGGWIDDVIMRITDVFFAIPGLLFLIVWTTIFEPGPISIFLGLGLIAWPSSARLMRAQVLSIRSTDYVMAAQALGSPVSRILWHYILPNAIAPIVVIIPLGIAGVILSEATLSFLGLGIQIPHPSWGIMVEMGRNYLLGAQWWYALFPSLWIMLTILGLNFLGDGLHDVLDPLMH